MEQEIATKTEVQTKLFRLAIFDAFCKFRQETGKETIRGRNIMDFAEFLVNQMATLDTISQPAENNHTITITQRSGDLMAYANGNTALWGCGKNAYEAVGNLVMNHPELFNLKIEKP